MFLNRVDLVKILLLVVTVCSFTGQVASNFSETTPNITPDSFTLQGNGTVSSTAFVVSLGAPQTATVIYRNEPQNVLEGFTTTMILSITECDEISWARGADGFAFFIAPSINTAEEIDYGGTLALSFKTNIAFIGFDLFLQQIKYNGTHVGENVLSTGPPNIYSVPDLSAWRCNPFPITVTIDYTPPSTFHIIASRGTVVAPAVSDFTIQLDITQYFTRTPLYVALSGATGDGFMRQEIISWEFASKGSVVPYLDCYEDLGGGQYKAHMGFDNLGAIAASLDVGPSNAFNPAPQDRGQVTEFPLGRSRFYPANPFSVVWDGTELTWNLTSNFVTFDANIPTLLCPANVTFYLKFTSLRNLTADEIAAIKQSLADFMGISPSRIILVAFDITQATKRSTTDALSEAELELEIASPGPETPGEPSAAEAVRDFVESAKNRTVGTQVIDPDGSVGLEFQDAFPKEIGGSGTGQLTTKAPVSPPLVAAPITVPTSIPSTPQKVPITSSAASFVYEVSLLAAVLTLVGL